MHMTREEYAKQTQQTILDTLLDAEALRIMREFPLDAAYTKVHRSNMSKLGPDATTIRVMPENPRPSGGLISVTCPHCGKEI